MSDFFNNFIGKNKNFIDRNKKVFLLLISILVVITVFLNSTYSLLFKEDVTDLQSYTTGVLQLTSNTINNSVTLTNSLPMSDTDGLKSTPYDFKITNTGNLAFKFDVKLLSTDTSNQINSQYIKVSVNGEDAVTLNSLTEGKIMENITLDSGRNTKVSLRVWLAEDTPNSQIGKVFNAKIVTEGYAVYTTESVLPNIEYVTPDISDFTYYTMDTDPGYADYMEDNHILLASYNGTHENIKIPNTYTVNGDSYDTLLLVDSDTSPAGDIGVFANNTVIKNVYIEENVKTSYVSGREGTTSGFGLFYGCSNLETVVIENPNIDYSDQMFNTGSSSAVEVYVPENSITYDSLMEWNSNSQLFGNSGGEIITFGGSNGDNSNGAYNTLVQLGLSVSEGTPSFDKTSCSTGCGEATVGIYETEDDLGTSYYFRGDVENNYVKFGKNASNQDMYWRIIRINGDGTVRMIYDGTSAHANGESSKDRQVTTSAYKSSPYKDNTYVGYMFGTPGVTTTGTTGYNATHSNSTDSTIKTYLEGDGTTTNEGWYKDNIIDTGYEEYVADAIYCNDRTLSTEDASYTGIGTTTTDYAAYQRNRQNYEPTLICERDEDKFTKETTLGNGKNKYPVGLITVDEVAYAGAYDSTANQKYYLYTGSYYWTMSPYSFFGSSAEVFGVIQSGGYGGSYNVDYSGGVRPVVSLKSNVLEYGSGSPTDPFRVEQGNN